MVKNFHQKPFDQGTKTKLDIFELYTRSWLPVFLTGKDKPAFKQMHIYDFFAGPGYDSVRIPGSPIRILKQLVEASQQYRFFNAVDLTVHFYDKNPDNIKQLQEAVATYQPCLARVKFDLRVLEFQRAFLEAESVLREPHSSKLVLLDPYGVNEITSSVFVSLVEARTCDFLMFTPSSVLYRFQNHSSLVHNVERPKEYYHAHRSVLEYFRGLIPAGRQYFLAPFSIKKDANIYGIIFGSAHPLGMQKFLEVAWNKDVINGEANFDIDRQSIPPGQIVMEDLFDGPFIAKLAIFESALETSLEKQELKDEIDVLKLCFQHGVRPQAASNKLKDFKKRRKISLRFEVPQAGNLHSPRPIVYL